jgi:hypothetical protein
MALSLASGTTISSDKPCSTAKYGRKFYTNSLQNTRFFPKTARNTEQWKKIFSTRTSVERTNKREKVDYHLKAGKHRSMMMWTIRIYGVMMASSWKPGIFISRTSSIFDLSSLANIHRRIYFLTSPSGGLFGMYLFTNK